MLNREKYGGSAGKRHERASMVAGRQDVRDGSHSEPELPVLPEVKGEMVTYDPEEGARLLQLAIQGVMAQKKKTRAKKV